MVPTQPNDQEHARTRPAEEMQATPNQEKSTENNASPLPDFVAQGQEQVQHVINQVSQQRHPRWWALKRGRLWLVVYAVILLFVLVLALAAHFYSVLPGDLPLTREFQENTNPVLYNVMFFVSFIGFPVQATMISIVVILALWVVRMRMEALFLLLSQLVDALDAVIKFIVARQRPAPDLVTVVQRLSSFSFPSGHTLHYTVFYGFLAFLLLTNFRASWARNLLIAICVVLILLIGPSRVYLGEHWPTDVLGAYLIGGLCLLPLILTYLWVKARYVLASPWPWLHHLPQQTVEVEKALAKEQ